MVRQGRGPVYRGAKILVLVCILAGASGCGYHFLGKGKGTLEEIKTIAIPYFMNKTYEPGIDQIFTDALVNEFVESREFVITTEDKAEVVMKGVLKSFGEQVISFDRNDRAMEYRITVSLEFSVEERATGKVLWRDKNITHNEEYRVDMEHVAPTDITDTQEHQVKQDIAVTEFNKDKAIKRLAAELAERIHDNLLEGF
jgi:outer membrane lipopolysaccharide assembly protein LptE/RlpB